MSGDNAAYLDAAYALWRTDPDAVEPAMRELFSGLDASPTGPTKVGPTFRPKSIFASRGGGAVDPAASDAIARRQAGTVQLINAYRVRGHFAAKIDPLARLHRELHEELVPSRYGLTEADLDHEVYTTPLFGMPPKATLRAVLEHLGAVYSGSIAAEFMNIDYADQKRWVLERLESLPGRHVLDRDQQMRILRKLCDAENFESMLHTQFPGTKRFSLEGAETLVPLLDLLNERAAALGVKEIVIGMAHRGRLNTLVNILEKPAGAVVAEFLGAEEDFDGSGDVKYHKGFSADIKTVRGDSLHLSLTPNPSHLEAVNAIVEGRVRAKQDRTGDQGRNETMPLLIHGDAAFAGQGLVLEVLNLSELAGYRTGGTVHIIVNNQIGFTTPPIEARSTTYATGVARMLGVPIFHVNGEDPRAVAAVVQMSMEYRQKFHRDVVIDMYCYRKHGHNEGDEPSYTQPLMYENIRSRPTPRSVYQQVLVEKGDLTEQEAQAIFDESQALMQEAAQGASADDYVGEPIVESAARSRWDAHRVGDIREVGDTTFPVAELRELLVRINTLPKSMKAHTKVKRLLKQRMEMIDGEAGLDWSMGEQAAFCTLLAEGKVVRLSGQDSGRGTFSHRHAVITDIETGVEYFPMVNAGPGRFGVYDSSLSEASVLGFELGYSFDTPEGLVMWEAQFGDFVNGAQVIIDQFLVAAEQKWNRLSNLVLLLPHGYEGQGPEHSSARPERFLLMCAEDNIQVANVTTPAQYFHMLRAQVKRTVRKPLVVMTPKSLLRHPLATNTLEELASGRFHPVLPETDTLGELRRIVFCSGKIYYELLQERRDRGIDDVALVRVEMIYPWPAEALAAIAAGSPKAELVWCQEEPANMGAYPVIGHWMPEAFGERRVRYVGRAAAASPATGSNKKHKAEQAAVIDGALT